MKVIDRLSRLPDKIFSRVIHIAMEQNKYDRLRRPMSIYSRLELSKLFRANNTKEGAEYWAEIQEKYFNDEITVTDQEYLIFTMEGDSKSEELSDHTMKKIITHVSESFGLNIKNRKIERVSLRFAMWDYYKTNTALSLAFIGAATCPQDPFDHTSVLSGIRAHKKLIESNDPLALDSQERIRRFTEII